VKIADCPGADSEKIIGGEVRAEASRGTFHCSGTSRCGNTSLKASQ
jgi:hypothetical protein